MLRPNNKSSLNRRLKAKADELGFVACRITSARPIESDNLIRWLKDNKHGTMRWMERDPYARCDPASLLSGAKSVICCALAYGKAGIVNAESAGFGRGHWHVPGAAPIQNASARFARGADYHKVVREKLEILARALCEVMSGARTKCCVDTSPIMEKALAARAGIGWQGKNMLLINPRFGSWFVLGEIITDVEIETDRPLEVKCGDCQRCIDECPAGALDGCALDAKRCLSYLSVEHRGDIDSELKPLVDNEMYGCDVCQLACPFNRDK